MALRTKTIEYAFQSRNGAALAAATRYDFAAITLNIPETTSRTFRSVILKVFCRDAVTAATSQTSPLVGIKLGAAAFGDATLGNPPGNSGESGSYIYYRDVTAYFTANFGAGASQTCQVGVQFAGTTTVNIGAKLIITYESEEQATRIKTVRIPLDSGLGALTATLAQIGTNQIPALSTFLPESSVVLRRVWFELWYNETTAGTANDASLGMQVDSETEHLTGIHESGLASSCAGWYAWEQTTATWVASGGGSVHAFKLRSSTITTASTFNHVGIVLCITYEYDHTNSTTILNSLVLSLTEESPIVVPGAVAGDKVRRHVDLWVEEPATITMVQSGLLVMYAQVAANNPSLTLGGGSERTYTDTNVLYCGSQFLTQRCDSGGARGSAWTLARGKNVLNFAVRMASASTSPSGFDGMLFLNYTSGKASAGDGAHNHSTWWMAQGSQAAGNGGTISAAQWFNIPESIWFRNCLAAFISGNLNSIGGVGAGAYIFLSAEAAAGELAGVGFYPDVVCAFVTENECGWYPFFDRVDDDHWDRWANDPVATRMDIEASRRLRLVVSTTYTLGLMFCLTYHSITFSVAGTISGSGGGTVNVSAIRDSDKQVVAAGSRSGNGAYSLTVYDNTDFFVESREDATHVGRSDTGVPV